MHLKKGRKKEKMLKEKNRKRRKSAVKTIFFLIFFVSCTQTPEYKKVHTFKNKIWEQEKEIDYTFNIKDTIKKYDITLFLRTTTDYKYNNLWVLLTTETPEGKKTEPEPIEIKIAHPDGVWIGKKTGSIVETNIYFKNRVFPKKGEYKIKLKQATTKEEVGQVLDLGLFIQKKS